jgi:hypothetical protein
MPILYYSAPAFCRRKVPDTTLQGYSSIRRIFGDIMSHERQHTYHRAFQYASYAARALGGARTQRHPTRQKLRCFICLRVQGA